MTARRDSADLAIHYEGLLKEQEDSGLSVSEFAEEVGLSAATLYSWRRRLRGREDDARLLEVSVIGDDGSSLGSPGLGGPLVLQVGERMRIEVRSDFDEDALARLLGVLDRC